MASGTGFIDEQYIHEIASQTYRMAVVHSPSPCHASALWKRVVHCDRVVHHEQCCDAQPAVITNP